MSKYQTFQKYCIFQIASRSTSAEGQSYSSHSTGSCSSETEKSNNSYQIEVFGDAIVKTELQVGFIAKFYGFQYLFLHLKSSCMMIPFNAIIVFYH